MIVRYTRRAQGDLTKILNYLDERSPRGALNVRLAIKRTIDATSHNPSIGHATASAAHSPRRPDSLAGLKGRHRDRHYARASIFGFKSRPLWRNLPVG
jgi:plasmid stabilization system protein ParE